MSRFRARCAVRDHPRETSFLPILAGTTIEATVGKTRGGRYLRVIYVTDPKPDSVFIKTRDPSV